MCSFNFYNTKKLISVVLFLIFTICSCKFDNVNQIQSREIILVGDIKNLPTKKIYLTDAHKWDILLDSSEIINNKFQFNLDTFKLPEPFLASVCILTATNKIEQLAVFNYKRTNTKDTFSNTGFMLSFGKTELSGDFNYKFHRVSIVPNKENDLGFDLKTEEFGSRKNIKFIKETIQSNPSSYFLLYKLYQNKSLYSETELKDILGLFEKKILNSKTAMDLMQYSSYLPAKGAAFPNSQLTNFKGENELLFNDSAKITMLIFWASWCGPCRLEIPELKNIRTKFPAQILSMKSISIDEDASNWQKALNEEYMPWQQFLAPYKDLVKIKAQFTVNAIPVIIFLDKNKNELKRFVGYSENNVIMYDKFINEYLTKAGK